MTAMRGEFAPIVESWLEWLEERCTIERHGEHLRRDCKASREEALRGCVMLERPKES